MPTVFITGANRGLGLEFTRQYAGDGWRVIATCRKPEQADDLKKLGGDIRIEPLNVDEPDDVRRLAGKIDEPVDLLISNAGVYGRNDPLATIDADDFGHTLHINTIAPVILASSFLSHLRKGKIKKLVAVSSLMGSIAENVSGGSLPYRASKAALNAAWKSIALGVKEDGIIAAVLHPGWVKTRMGGDKAPLDTQTSISGMRTVIEKMDMTKSGGFFSYDGKMLPW
ncbi:MAG: SDR family oxidoreductase [Pseudomonadota bacterium]